jgi:hypothetical protein
MYFYAETVEIKVGMSNGEAVQTPGVGFGVGAVEGLAGGDERIIGTGRVGFDVGAVHSDGSTL